MTSFEVRKKFISFFEKYHHILLPSSSLIPQKDPSLLFVNAGMNQFKNFFLAEESPDNKNIMTIQKCLRAGGKHNDLETVGTSLFHHTFFEMMGNFSFGGYFKEKAIDFAWEFLTKEIGMDVNSLWVSVYEEDEESYELWKQKIPGKKIYLLKEDNFWQMGENGPCGPCSEIHYYKGEEKRPDASQLIEIWNLVFMEFNKVGDVKEKLPVPCVDTGMGLERLCSLLQNKKSNYHTDLFLEIISSLEVACNKKYDFKEKIQNDQQKAFRVLADHSRAISFLISDGVFPSNIGRNYVLRRIIRRALFYSEKLDPKKNLLQVGIKNLVSLMSEVHPLLKEKEDLILSLVEEERKRFLDSLKGGRKKLAEKMKSLQGSIDAKTVYELYETYGFPMDLTRLILKEKNWTMATKEEIQKYIDKEKKAQFISQQTKKKTEPASLSIWPETEFTGYEKRIEEGKILHTESIVAVKGIHSEISEEGSVMESTAIQFMLDLDVKKGKEAFLCLDKSCFYPEGGGPIGDRGWLETSTGKAQVIDCQKKGNRMFHKVKVYSGEIKPNQICKMEVDEFYRKEISASHTATHLLNSALRLVLGKSIVQAGSQIKPGRFSFDFTYSRALTKKERDQIEEQILNSIKKEEEIIPSEKIFDQAKKEGALFLEGENYDSKVRIIEIGDKMSKELCGGIHVKNTKEIQQFKLVSEKGIQSGVRRIIAYTGELAQIWESYLVEENKKLRQYLNLSQRQIKKEKKDLWVGEVEKENPFLIWFESKKKELKKLREQIIHLKEKEIKISFSDNQALRKVQSFFHPFAQQNLKFREILQIPLPKEKEENLERESAERTFDDFFEDTLSLLDLVKKKEEEIQDLKSQWFQLKKLRLTTQQLVQEAKKIQVGGISGQLIVSFLPVKDRQILSEISDRLLEKLSSGLVILLGEGEQEKYPILVSCTKNFKNKLSAGDILKKTIAPHCKGKGGGKDFFAQGSIKDKKAFSSLESVLFKEWSF